MGHASADASRSKAVGRSLKDIQDLRVCPARLQFEHSSKTFGLALIKAREIAEDKEAVEQYGSSDSGASLGDILGA